MNNKEFYRWFREEVRDAPEALAFYRKFRDVRDKVVDNVANEADNMLDTFKDLPLDKQIELFNKFFEYLFGKK